MSVFRSVVIPATGKHTATIFFLHGLGDTGHGWASDLADIKPPHAKLICPHAPTRSVTMNMGMEMPAWFDLRSLDKKDTGVEDVEGVIKASEDIITMIDAEIKNGIQPERIILGGFSQGAALSLYTGLTGPHVFGGVVVMSGYIPIRNTIDWANVKNPHVLQCHGDKDTVVHYEIGVGTSKLLKEMGKITNHQFITYDNMTHTSCAKEMSDLEDFLKSRLPPITPNKPM